MCSKLELKIGHYLDIIAFKGNDVNLIISNWELMEVVAFTIQTK